MTWFRTSTCGCWGARWTAKVGREAKTKQQQLGAVVASAEREGPRHLPIDSQAMLDFNRFILHDYTPPNGKRILVVLQCSVRRPFSKSPSHGSMRRAVYAATGFWPRKEFEQCPDYTPQMVHELQAEDRRIFEYWANAASYVPMSDYRYYVPRMRGAAKRHSDPRKVKAPLAREFR